MWDILLLDAVCYYDGAHWNCYTPSSNRIHIVTNHLCSILILVSIIGTPQVIPLVLLGAILGLPALLICLTTKRVVYVYWMLVYLTALPIWNFMLPAYAFWHFDDFSWGETRKVGLHLM